MMTPCPFLLHLILVLLFVSSPSSANSTTLSLTRLTQSSVSSARAHLLKYSETSTTVKTPLLARGYGGYSFNLSFGTPPQTLKFAMDTSSSLVWFPCTDNYICSSCDFLNVKPPNITVFKPNSSNSSHFVGCGDATCKRTFPGVRCRKHCENSSMSCCECCPPYNIKYETGSTTGRFLSESLTFPGMKVDNFFAGCSDSSSDKPDGIAGFGPGWASLPSQLNLTSFSYCLVSHRFNESTVSSNLVLNGTTRGEGGKMQYTPFTKNTNISSIPNFLDYYYVNLKKIMVGGIDVNVSQNYLVLDDAGNGGTIVDSGTAFTIIEKSVFDLIAKELKRQVGKNSSDTEAEETGLGLCFNVSEVSSSHFPELSFVFKGGATMNLPFDNYILSMNDSVCTSMLSISTESRGVWQGPAVILGNYLQQNFYMEYDLKKNRLGFRKQICD